MRTYPGIGVQIPQVWLPRPGTNLTQWAVIACDQYTSQPEYWHLVEELVGDAPSTLHLTFPEVYLEAPGSQQRIQSIHASMKSYLEGGLLVPHEGMLYVERRVENKVRHGLMLALDLEQYDFNKGSHSLVRASEGTILERLPPRMRIRQGAPLELPHILVLIDDPGRTVIEPLATAREWLQPLYDFDLMLDSGHLAGYLVNDQALEAQVIRALEGLADPQAFREKYGLRGRESVLLFAMGDGNHSLATAKAIWEQLKPQVGMQHPARYALVEIENVHDEGLEFEPIHRVVFGLRQEVLPAMQGRFGEDFEVSLCRDQAEMVSRVEAAAGSLPHRVGLITPQGFGIASIANPPANLPVGTLQAFLDDFLKQGGAEKIDYVHGVEVAAHLGAQPGNTAFYVPGMHKSELFKTVILDGALPRKTFSMGEAHEKRFYMECRKIT